MTLTEAHGYFAGCPPPELPFEVLVLNMDCWVAGATALASLSGMLADCKTAADLGEALEHGKTLLSAEIVGEAELRAEVGRVIAAVLEEGEALERQRGRA